MKKNYKLFSFGLIAFAINSASAQCPTPSLVSATPSVICAGATTSINATAVLIGLLHQLVELLLAQAQVQLILQLVQL